MIKNSINVEYKRDGLIYKQVKNDLLVYMYDIYFENKKIGIDVFKADLTKADKYLDYDRYVIPKTSKYGLLAWSYGMYAINKAELKYQELIKHQEDNTHQPSI